MLMYALSTMAMNHRDFFRKIYGPGPPAFEVERELTYKAAFAEEADPRLMARQILSDLDMDGAHGVRMSPGGKELVITRFQTLTPARITYTPGEDKIVIEKQVFHSHAFLERMHRRRGYHSDYPQEDTWAFSVDLVILAMIFWAASGLWMWWELKVTRLSGAAFALAGIALFGFYLFTM